MNDKLFVLARWGPRSEPREECARRLHDFLVRLADLDASLSEWCLAKCDEEASTPIANDPRYLARLLEQNRSDTDGRVIPDLGTAFSAWTPAGATLDVVCGATSSYVKNTVTLMCEPHSESGDRDPFRLIELVARVWHPDWATAVPRAELATAARRREPPVGLFVYVANAEPLRKLSVSRVVSLPVGGAIVSVNALSRREERRLRRTLAQLESA